MPRIRAPRPDELEATGSLERDADRAFAAIGMADIATDEPLSVAELEAFVVGRHAWVATDERDLPQEYLLSSRAGSRHLASGP